MENKREFVTKQLQELIRQDCNNILVSCECDKKIPIHLAFRCLYCGQYYCQKCAEEHFGKSREDYNKVD